MVKIFQSALVIYMAAVSFACAGELAYSPIVQWFFQSEWRDPSVVPPRFRKHCGYDQWGKFYCSERCGPGYQIYYCSQVSFGCCHVGHGYCDWEGLLRCRP